VVENNDNHRQQGEGEEKCPQKFPDDVKVDDFHKKQLSD
jgi:hypothetical protein